MKQNPKSKRTYAVAVIAAAGIAALLWFMLRGNERPANPVWQVEGRPVKVLEIVPGNGLRTRSFPGIAHATREVRLSFRIKGPLRELPVDVGQKVERGGLIARIDPRDFEVQVDRLRARIVALQAQLVDAQLQYNRYSNLYSTKAVPKAEFDHAKSRYDETAARIEATRQELQAAQHALDDTILRAPFDGFVHKKHVENFDYVDVREPIVSFLDCTTMETTVGVPEELVSENIRFVDFSCTFDAYPGKSFSARLKELGRKPRPSNQTYPLTVVLTGPEAQTIRPGMAATLQVTFSDSTDAQQIMVPVESIVSNHQGAQYVFVYDRQSGTVQKRIVTPGVLTDKGFTIQAGLSAGDLVVITGASFLQEGQKVTLNNTGKADQAR